jgi:serine/threonine protein kinase
VRILHHPHCPSDSLVVVWEAFDSKYSRTTLLKTGPPDEVDREVRIYEILNGTPGIPELYTWCVNKRFSYLSMQQCGVNLTKYTGEKGPLSLKDALTVAAIVVGRSSCVMDALTHILQADTLRAAHDKGVIHCDVKPDNIVCPLADGITSPILIDWGYAAVTTQPVPGKVGYTPGFVSVPRLDGSG